MSLHPLVAQLAKRRRLFGLSMEGLADRIGVHASQLSRWENGRALPKTLNFIDWANALGLEIKLEVAGGAARPVADKAVGADPNGTHQKVGIDRRGPSV